jgi:ADP-heptose:LPS heptosyltransferase
MNPATLLYIDRFLSIPNQVIGWFYLQLRRWYSASKNYNDNTLVIKLMGMGSMVKLTSVFQQNQVDLSKITLVTFSQNLEIAKNLGYTRIEPLSKNWFKLLLQCLLLPFKLKYSKVIDLERDVNATSLLRKYMGAIGTCQTVFFNNQADVHLKNDMGFNLNTRSQLDLIKEVLPFLEKSDNPKRTKEISPIIKEKKILININASNYLSVRKFPIEKFVSVIQNLAANYPEYRLVLTGSKSESDYVGELEKMLDEKEIKVENYSGIWSLSNLQIELENASLFITNDSGPMHIAVWLKTPTLTIWGPTQANYSGYPESEYIKNVSLNLSCSPCFVGGYSKWGVACDKKVPCMNNLENVDVMKAVKGILN